MNRGHHSLRMWLGEQITQRGIGNGVSLLITFGILASPGGRGAATYQLFRARLRGQVGCHRES